MDQQQTEALEFARVYRGLGLVPLPSRSDRKQPMMASYAEFRNTPVPDDVYSEGRWCAHNLQVMCGVQTTGARKVVVVDCDGELAHDAWLRMCAAHDYTPDTWVSRTGSGGWHYWFLLTQRIHECPSRQIWGLWDSFGKMGEGFWVPRNEIRVLGDGALAVAPPSLHVKTGGKYRWQIDSTCKRLVAYPHRCPQWILSMPRVQLPRTAYDGPTKGGVDPPSSQIPTIKTCAYLNTESRRVVLDSIPDKLAIARDWGLVIAHSKPNREGWIPCRAVGRDDRNPSASFHVETGVYFDFDTYESYSLLDLGVLLGHFADWRSCLSSLHPASGRHQ